MIDLTKAPLSEGTMDAIEEQIQENLELSAEIVAERISNLEKLLLERLMDDKHSKFIYKVESHVGMAFTSYKHVHLGLDGYYDGGEYGDDSPVKWVKWDEILAVSSFGSDIWRLSVKDEEPIWLQRVIVRLP